MQVTQNMIKVFFVEDDSENFLVFLMNFLLISLRGSSVDQKSVCNYWFDIYRVHPHQQFSGFNFSYPLLQNVFKSQINLKAQKSKSRTDF